MSTAAPSLDLALAGTPYRVVRAIARGGMGAVYLAEHTELDTPVVVKLIHAKFAGRPELADRLRIEAQALARLRHPNLVSVTDLGRTSDGRPYLVMEWLRGRTLRDELKERGVIPVEQALDWVIQALAGLEAAHQAGLVHRDVKLDNLFLCSGPQPTIKVLDFGIAKVLRGEGARGERGADPLGGRALEPRFRTAEGTVLGTPAFAAPEQAAAGPVDARADVYGAAVVLYRLIAGRGPFDAKNAFELLRAHVSAPVPPPSTFAPQPIPKALDELVVRALSKSPDDRPPSAAAFAAELSAVLSALRASDDTTTVRLDPPSRPGGRPSQARTVPVPRTQARAESDVRADHRRRRRSGRLEPAASYVLLAVVTAVFASLALWSALSHLGFAGAVTEEAR